MVTVAVEILSLNDAVERGLQVVNILYDDNTKRVMMIGMIMMVMMMMMCSR